MASPHCPAASVPHVVLDLVYGRHGLSLPAVNVQTRDIKRSCVQGLQIPFAGDDPRPLNLAADVFPRLTTVKVCREWVDHFTHGLRIQDIVAARGLIRLDVRNCGLRGHNLFPCSLKHLDVAGNTMEYDSERHLSHLTNLESLDISCCWECSSEFITSLRRLTELHASHNRDILISHIAELTGLRTLNLRKCRIEDDTYHESFRHLSALTDLTYLDLANVTCAAGYSWPGAFARHVSKLTSLVSLNLAGCVTAGCMESLAALTALTALTLRGSRLGNPGGRGVANLTTLRHLDVWKCYIQDHSVLAPLRGLTELAIEPKHPGVWYKDTWPCLVMLNAEPVQL